MPGPKLPPHLLRVQNTVPPIHKARKVSSTAVAYVEVCSLLSRKPATRVQMMEWTGLSSSTLWEFVRLLKARNCIFISKWHRVSDRGNWAPMYSWGSEVDVEKPRPLTEREHHQRYKTRKKLRENSLKSSQEILNESEGTNHG